MQDTIVIMQRPLIAITSDYSDGYDARYPSLLTFRIKSTYAKAVIAAGGIPVIIPFDREIDPDNLVRRIDGLIISGSGDDIHPFFISRKIRPPEKNSISRQEFEFRIASSAIDFGIPVLGICGGMQLLNVLFGGNLIEDIPSSTGSKIHKSEYFKEVHKIRILKGSHLFRAVKTETLYVNSTHHQAVYSVPQCFNITATAPDGIVEAIELNSDNLVMGLQFHPEAMIRKKRHLRIFEYFIKKARER